MNKTKLVIVDYGLGNLYSLAKAVRLFCSDVTVSDDPKLIMQADRLIIPGVGAFAAGMEGLAAKGLIQPIMDFAAANKPILGICLGAQLMLDVGFEFGQHKGLGIVPGTVELFPESVSRTEKVPHIGWNGIRPYKATDWQGTVLSGVSEDSKVYFVHSYIMKPTSPDHILAIAEYGGLEFCAAIRKGNVFGTQFHPEKSGEVGLNIIKNFVCNSYVV